MASADVVACPYTAGGCPLFNTQLPLDTPRCTGGCSPPASTTLPEPSILSNSPPLPELDSLLYGPGSNNLGINITGNLPQYLYPEALLLPPLSPRDTNLNPDGGPCTGSLATRDHKRDLTDIEELLLWPKKNKRSNGTEHSVDNAAKEISQDEPIPDDSATPFISKLVYLLGQQEAHDYVRWDVHGRAVIVAHTKDETLSVLAKYFRHTTVASFVRQLNIYGFKRLQTTQLLAALGPSTDFSAADYCAFAHPAFFRSTPERHCRLANLKPQGTNKDKPSKRRRAKRRSEIESE